MVERQERKPFVSTFGKSRKIERYKVFQGYVLKGYLKKTAPLLNGTQYK